MWLLHECTSNTGHHFVELVAFVSLCNAVWFGCRWWERTATRKPDFRLLHSI